MAAAGSYARPITPKEVLHYCTDGLCGDVSHLRNCPIGQCSAPKSLRLYKHDGSYAIVHETQTREHLPHRAEPLKQAPTDESRALLRTAMETVECRRKVMIMAEELRQKHPGVDVSVSEHVMHPSGEQVHDRIVKKVTNAATSPTTNRVVKPGATARNDSTSTMSPAFRAATSVGSRTRATHYAETYNPVSITMASNPSPAAVQHGIFPRRGANAARNGRAKIQAACREAMEEGWEMVDESAEDEWELLPDQKESA